MKIEIDNSNVTPEMVVKRMFFLAYNAAGGPTGMGFLQAVSNATEDDVFNNVRGSGDYCMQLNNSPDKLHADYVFGRMIKASFGYDKSSVTIPDSKPRIDYESWCGVYPTYKDLFDAALKSLVEIKQEKTG
jgi:hypothetical protein